MIIVFITPFGKLGMGKLNKEKGIIENCVGIISSMTPNKGVQINIVPFFEPFSNEHPSIELSKVFAYSKVKPDFEKVYIEVTTNLKITTSEKEAEKFANDIMRFKTKNPKLK